MRRTRLKILLAAAIVVMVAAAIGLLVTLTGRDKPEGTKKTAIPEVPEGSVLVWLRTADYSQVNGGETVCTARYTYDKNGRCIRKEEYLDEEDTEVTTFEYDAEKTHRTISTRLTDDGVSRRKYVTIYAADGEIISSCDWEYRGDRYRKTLERISEPSVDGKIELEPLEIEYDYGDAERVSWSEYDATARTVFRYEVRFVAKDDESEDEDVERIMWFAKQLGSCRLADIYDEQGRLCASYEVQPDGSYKQLSGIDYSEDGTETTTTTYGQDGPDDIVYVKRDDQGRPLIRMSMDQNGFVNETREREYQELASGGYRVKTRTADRSGTEESFAEYDADGKLVKSGKIIDGQEIVHSLITKDEQGRTIRIDMPTFDRTCEMEYDEYGNCVKETVTTAGEVEIYTTEFEPVVLERDKVAYAEEFYDPCRNEQ